MADVEKIKQLMKSCATDDLCDEECPYHGKGCVDAMMRDAVDVIEKQQAEIAKLRSRNEELYNLWLSLTKN